MRSVVNIHGSLKQEAIDLFISNCEMSEYLTKLEKWQNQERHCGGNVQIFTKAFQRYLKVMCSTFMAPSEGSWNKTNEPNIESPVFKFYGTIAKGPVIRSTHAKYENFISLSLMVIQLWPKLVFITDISSDRVIAMGHPPCGGALMKNHCSMCSEGLYI